MRTTLAKLQLQIKNGRTSEHIDGRDRKDNNNSKYR